MSYCRYAADSNVYVFNHVNGGIECCGCWLTDNGHTNFETPLEMLTHLLEHRAAGHLVPEFALDRLRDEIASGRKTA